MNKIIQINLAGVIFNIEEAAYEKLHNYNTKLKISFNNNEEVVSDIQHRMAELFNERIASDRTIFINHVDEIIALMGEVENINEATDNKAIQETENLKKITKLRRNPYDESLGGVCSGIASFWGIDPVLVRILFIVSVVVYGTGILFYILLWIIIPKATGEEAEAMKQQKQQQTKKLFRNPDNRLIGGVCAGLANYFGLNMVWIRLAFAASIFLFGTGFWLYIVLWIIIPKAVTASDKLLMRGINPSVKNLNDQYHNAGNNATLSRKGIRKTEKIISSAFKLFAGFVLFVTFVVIVSISVALLAFYMGIGNIEWLTYLLAITLNTPALMWSVKLGVLFTILTPLTALLLLLLKLTFNLKTTFKKWLMALTVLFITGFGLLLYAGIAFAGEISYKGSKKNIIPIEAKDTVIVYGVEDKSVANENNKFTINSDEGELTFYNKGVIVNNNRLFLEISSFTISEVTTGKKPQLKITFKANGKNQQSANNNIKQIVFEPTIEGNNIFIPHFLSIAPEGPFRWQEVKVELQVPDGFIIVLDESAKEIIDDSKMDQADGKVYKLKNNELICIDCNENQTISEEVNINAGPIRIEVKEKNSSNESVNIRMNNEEPVKTTVTTKTDTKNKTKTTIEETKAGPVSIKKKKIEKIEPTE
jgi:phage shock protein PspC (stress-responsive transcriptional regulator)